VWFVCKPSKLPHRCLCHSLRLHPIGTTRPPAHPPTHPVIHPSTQAKQCPSAPLPLTQDGHDLHSSKAGLPGGLGIEGRLPHQAVGALLPGQVSIGVAPIDLDFHRLDPRLLPCRQAGRQAGRQAMVAVSEPGAARAVGNRTERQPRLAASQHMPLLLLLLLLAAAAAAAAPAATTACLDPTHCSPCCLSMKRVRCPCFSPHRTYMRSSISAQSWASVPPAPDCRQGSQKKQASQPASDRLAGKFAEVSAACRGECSDC
jgi:hypothetical protein